jgi:hypothetical protein
MGPRRRRARVHIRLDRPRSLPAGENSRRARRVSAPTASPPATHSGSSSRTMNTPAAGKKAFAAGYREGRNNAVANIQLANSLSSLDHLAHEFMANNIALLHTGH